MSTQSQYLQRHWLWLLVNAAGLALLLRYGWMIARVPDSRGFVLFADEASQDVVLFSGKTALYFLVLSLACTPAARILKWHEAITVRKSLGLWGFVFGCLHGLYFMGGKALLYEADAWSTVWYTARNGFGEEAWGKVPFALYGYLTLLLLIPLVLTSSRRAMRLLGKNWKRLHRLVYLIVPMAVYHYWLRDEQMNGLGGWPTEGYDGRQPLYFAVIVGILLILRVPSVRRWIQGWPSTLRTVARRPKHEGKAA